MQKRKWTLILAASLAVLWVGVIGAGKWIEHKLNADLPQPDALPTGLNVYWAAPAFSFSDQNLQAVTDQSLRGHVWIADFFYSQCTTACPVLTSKLMLLQKQITSPNVRFISFSVDPEHDTPPVLKKYADLWQGDQSRWKLLSTDPAGLANVATGMKVTVAASGDKDNPILHSTLFVLVDAQGQVRGIYDSSDSDALAHLVTDTQAFDGSASSDVHHARPSDTSAERGRLLYGSMGCLACHSQSRIAPSLQSLYNGQVRLDDHRTIWADEAYLHESIVDPGAKIVAGYSRSMPSYRGFLDDSQVMDLVVYIKSLSQNPPGRHGLVTTSTTAPADDAELLVDPVCKMQVTKDMSAPHLFYKGKLFVFCSDHCKEQFLKNPEKYALTQSTPN